MSRQPALLRNPILVEFLVAELREHTARVEQEANGSLLTGPRLNLLRQATAEIEQGGNGTPS